MDRLARSDFVQALTGEVYLSQHEAIRRLKAKLDAEQPPDPATDMGAHI